MKLFSILLIGNLKKYKAIESEAVAKAMFIIAQKNYKGFHIIESDSIQKIANKKSWTLVQDFLIYKISNYNIKKALL